MQEWGYSQPHAGAQLGDCGSKGSEQGWLHGVYAQGGIEQRYGRDALPNSSTRSGFMYGTAIEYLPKLQRGNCVMASVQGWCYVLLHSSSHRFPANSPARGGPGGGRAHWPRPSCPIQYVAAAVLAWHKSNYCWMVGFESYICQEHVDSNLPINTALGLSIDCWICFTLQPKGTVSIAADSCARKEAAGEPVQQGKTVGMVITDCSNTGCDCKNVAAAIHLSTKTLFPTLGYHCWTNNTKCASQNIAELLWF